MVASGNPQLLEAKRLHQPERVLELDICYRTTRQSDKESQTSDSGPLRTVELLTPSIADCLLVPPVRNAFHGPEI